jgi:hypothetical protein
LKRHVVDTNVAVVANGRKVTASQDCQDKAVLYLLEMVETGCVMIDTEGSILSEYKKRLFAKGEPGTGDRFYFHVLINQRNKKRVRRYDLLQARANPLRQAFVNGTLKAFDTSDRPLALCATVARTPVATCSDSDWTEHEVGLDACGVKMEYICGRAAAVKARRKAKATKRRVRRT